MGFQDSIPQVKEGNKRSKDLQSFNQKRVGKVFYWDSTTLLIFEIQPFDDEVCFHFCTILQGAKCNLVYSMLNVARCNLGKVKIEPMLVTGCVLWGQQITPKRMWHDAGWSQGFGASSSLAWLLACMFVNLLILLIVGVTTRGLYEPLQISCCSCSESFQFLADRSRSLSIRFSESLWIHADLCRSICRDAQFESQRLPPLQMFQPFGKYGGLRPIFFHWYGSVWRCQLAAACRGASRSWGCHGYLPALAISAQASWEHLRHQFLSSSIGDEFNLSQCILFNIPAPRVDMEPPSGALYFHRTPTNLWWHQFQSSHIDNEFIECFSPRIRWKIT